VICFFISGLITTRCFSTVLGFYWSFSSTFGFFNANVGGIFEFLVDDGGEPTFGLLAALFAAG
jgi:hypothetical protein